MPTARRIVLLGGGGHASDVLSLIDSINGEAPTWEVVGVADDSLTAASGRFEGRARHLGKIADALVPDDCYIAAVGYPDGRRAISGRADSAGMEAAVLVHPRAEVETGVELGIGSTVFALAHISALARIGPHVLVSHGALIGHDCAVGAFSSVMPGCNISGDVAIGEGVLIGTGASVVQGLQIGDGATIGAGAVVVTDIPAGVTAVGVPAKVVSGR